MGRPCALVPALASSLTSLYHAEPALALLPSLDSPLPFRSPTSLFPPPFPFAHLPLPPSTLSSKEGMLDAVLHLFFLPSHLSCSLLF